MQRLTTITNETDLPLRTYDLPTHSHSHGFTCSLYLPLGVKGTETKTFWWNFVLWFEIENIAMVSPIFNL